MTKKIDAARLREQTPEALYHQAKTMGMWFSRQINRTYIHVRRQLPGTEPYTAYDMKAPATRRMFGNVEADKFIALIADHFNYWADSAPFEWNKERLWECVHTIAYHGWRTKYPTLRGFAP